MKITLDTEGDDLTARMYLAAVVGPARRPLSQAKQVNCTVNNPAELVNNRTSRVLAVTVVQPLQAGVLVQFTQPGGGPPFSVTLGNLAGITSDRFFVLKPGDQLYATTAANTALSVFVETF